MKTRTSNQIELLSILFMAAWATLPVTSAQTQELDIQTYAGLTVVGEVGKVYSIEYETDLTDPAESAWRCLEYLQLPASPYLWADKSAPATGKWFYRAVAMEARTNMAFIPPGAFRMGSPEDEEGRWEAEGPQTAVTISRGYWIGKYEVTQGEYEAVTGENPSWFNGVQNEGTEWETVSAIADNAVRLVRGTDSVWRATVSLPTVLTLSSDLSGKAALFPMATS